MKFSELPVISSVSEAGADDRIWDFLLLIGPVVLGLVVVFGRSVFTESVASGYLVVCVSYVLYKGLLE